MRKLLTGSLLALIFGAAPLLTATDAQAQIGASVSVGVRIPVAPPPPRVEIVPAAPSPRHVWIPGHWGWNGTKHVWVGGYHDLPPHRSYRWVPAAWLNEGGTWVFHQGHWGPLPVAQPVVEEVIVDTPPPPPQEEVIPASPGPGHVWIPGHHRWDPMTRRHIWTGGHYRLGEPGHVWIPAHWVRTWRGWQFAPGHWR